jgi:hypothetical protein
MNLILEKVERIPFFTDMRATLCALGISAADFDWYLSDVETNYYGDEFSSEDQWMTGGELRHLLDHNDIQFIWAVFSAVPIGYRHNVPAAPHIDGNPDYWSGFEVRPQLSGAIFEIACWDSSATILVGLPAEAEARFLTVFPEAGLLQNAAVQRAG